MSKDCKTIFDPVEQGATARELIQCITGKDDGEELPMPGKCMLNAPEQISMYTDGSIKDPKGDFWMV